MPARNNQPLSSHVFELYIEGKSVTPIAMSVTPTTTVTSVPSTVLSDTQTNSTKIIPRGDLTISCFYKNEVHDDSIFRYWDDAQPSDDPLNVVWSIGNGIRVGEIVNIACMNPVSMSQTAAAEDLIRVDLVAETAGALVSGVLKSAQVAAGNKPLSSAVTTDYAAQAIGGRGPAVYTPTVAVDGGGEAIGVLGVVGSVTGSDATRPQAFIDLPAAWQGGTVPAAADNMVIRVEHGGVTRSTRVFNTGDQLSTIVNEISDFQWDDGFEIDHDFVSSTRIRFTGNQVGANVAFTFAASNPLPFRGTFSGALGRTQVRVVSATGTGGSRTYTGLNDLAGADDHHLPASSTAVAPVGTTQIGLMFALPVIPPMDSAYNFSLNYNINYAIHEVYT